MNDEIDARIEDIAQAIERSSMMPPHVAAQLVRSFKTQIVGEWVTYEGCHLYRSNENGAGFHHREAIDSSAWTGRKPTP